MSVPYHHGDLRRALLDAAIEHLRERPDDPLSLRQLARQVGVSHAAPAHHFTDKRGLLIAIAAEGFDRLHQSLARVWESTGSFLDVGVGYVTFAVEHPVHFSLMFRRELAGEPRLDASRQRTREILTHSAAGGRRSDRAVAGWAIAHGLSSLVIDGQVSDRRAVPSLARAVLSHLRG